MQWLKAMKGELKNFLNRGVWIAVTTDKLKPGQRPIKAKLVFKKKVEQDGSISFKGRIVVRGFM